MQSACFDRVLRRSNLRLMVMSGGQYELKRRRTADNQRSQSGLELDVIDHYNGSERSVKPLRAENPLRRRWRWRWDCPMRSSPAPGAYSWTPCLWMKGWPRWTRNRFSRRSGRWEIFLREIVW